MGKSSCCSLRQPWRPSPSRCCAGPDRREIPTFTSRLPLMVKLAPLGVLTGFAAGLLRDRRRLSDRARTHGGDRNDAGARGGLVLALGCGVRGGDVAELCDLRPGRLADRGSLHTGRTWRQRPGRPRRRPAGRSRRVGSTPVRRPRPIWSPPMSPGDALACTQSVTEAAGSMTAVGQPSAEESALLAAIDIAKRVEHAHRRRIGQPVIDGLRFPAGRHEPLGAHLAQMLRCGRLRKPGVLRQIPDRRLAFNKAAQQQEALFACQQFQEPRRRMGAILKLGDFRGGGAGGKGGGHLLNVEDTHAGSRRAMSTASVAPLCRLGRAVR